MVNTTILRAMLYRNCSFQVSGQAYDHVLATQRDQRPPLGGESELTAEFLSIEYHSTLAHFQRNGAHWAFSCCFAFLSDTVILPRVIRQLRIMPVILQFHRAIQKCLQHVRRSHSEVQGRLAQHCLPAFLASRIPAGGADRFPQPLPWLWRPAVNARFSHSQGCRACECLCSGTRRWGAILGINWHGSIVFWISLCHIKVIEFAAIETLISYLIQDKDTAKQLGWKIPKIQTSFVTN